MTRCKSLLIFHLLGFLLIAAAPALQADEYQGTAVFTPGDLEITKRGGLDLVSLEDGARTMLVGAPSLPFVQVNIAVPTDAKILGVEVPSIQSLELQGHYDLLPTTEPITVSGQAPDDPFCKDPGMYGRNEDFPGIYAEQAGTWDLAGQDFVTLNLYPVQYNPVTQKLKLITAMDFKVIYEKASNPSRETYNFSDKIKRHYTKVLRSMAFNPQDVTAIPDYVGGATTSLEPGQYEAVIITLFSFHDNFQPLIEWRNQMGMPTKIVNSLWVLLNYSGATSQEKFRNFIIDAHTTWGAAYFILGGDTGSIACSWDYYHSETIPNDTYYSDYDNDWICELYVGRASINTVAQADTFVNKVLTYEKSPPDNYGDTVFFMGFDLDGSTQSENCKISIKNMWLPKDISFCKEYDSEAGDHIYDTIDYMNAGQNLVNHIDHCNTSYIGIACVNHGTGFDGGWAQNFTNGTRYSNFYTLGCWPGNFPDTCWGEYFTRDDQGGITFVGNTRSGWYNPGYYTTYSHKYEKKWWRALYDNNAYLAGETLATSRNLFYPPDDLYKYIYTELNLLGDPCLHLWTKNPVPLDVSHAAYINMGSQTFNLHVEGSGAPLENALVCVMKGDEVYEYETTDVGGDVALAIDPTTSGDLLITVTAQNHKYYQYSIPVESAPIIYSIEPRCGTTAGLELVTIKGDNFYTGPETKVTIGGNDLFAMEVKDLTTITGYTPLGPNGWHDVEVTCPYGGDTLADGFRYFPTGGLPFNAVDIHAEMITAPADATLIASGKAYATCIAFLSFGPGPTTTPYGAMGLDVPFIYLFAPSLNSLGYTLLPLSLTPGLGPLDFYVHVLGLDGTGNPVWSYGGNNPNGTGGIWFHLDN